MKSILDKENNRNKCQKFTPLEIVENILDLAGYSNNLMGKRILENSVQEILLSVLLEDILWMLLIIIYQLMIYVRD